MTLAPSSHAAGRGFSLGRGIELAANIQILVDWSAPAIGAGSTAGSNWTDITQYVRLDSPISITRGRQDNISQVQPGKATFTVENNTGMFTPQKEGAAWKTDMGYRVQINVADESGTMHTRFDGQIAQLNAAPSVNGEENLVTVSCTDVLGFLNRLPETMCWTVEYCRSLKPDLQYLLNEQAQSTTSSGGSIQQMIPVVDSSGNNGPALQPRIYSGISYAPTEGAGYQGTVSVALNYQGGTSPVEAGVPNTSSFGTWDLTTSLVTSSPLPSINMAGTINASTSNLANTGGSAQFSGQMPFLLNTGGSNQWTALCWVWPDVTTQNYEYIDYCMAALCLGSSKSGACIVAGAVPFANSDSGGGNYYIQWYNNFLWAGTSINQQAHTGDLTAAEYNGPYMLAITCNGDTITMTLGGNYYGYGIELGTASITVNSNLSFNTLNIGGMQGGGQGWIGNISNVCVYKDSALSTAQLTTLATYGAQGPYNVRSGTAVTTLIQQFTDIPSFWTGTFDRGGLAVDYYDISGQNVMSSVQAISQAAHGEIYVDATGKLNWAGRGRRMGALSPTLLPEGSYTADIQPQWTQQRLVNSEVLGSQIRPGGTTTIAKNDESIAQYGVFPNGTVQSPTTGPYKVDGEGNLTARQTASPGTAVQYVAFSNSQLEDAASWDVNTQGQGGMWFGSVVLDLFSNLPGGNEYVAPSDVYALEIGKLIELEEHLKWWPDAEPDAAVQFIEGVTETYSVTESTVAFYTSPASQGLAWQPGSAMSGTLDESAIVGIGVGANPDEPEPVFTPLPVSVLSSTSNVQETGYNGFVGAGDLRSWAGNLQYALAPPAALVLSQSTQNFTSGTAARITWDTTQFDTVGGWNFYEPNDYVVQLEGWYEIYLNVPWSGNSGGQRTCWIGHNQTGSGVRQINPVSFGASVHSAQPTAGGTTSALIYCYAGDALSAWGLQDSGATQATNIAHGGPTMSIRWVGQGSGRN